MIFKSILWHLLKPIETYIFPETRLNTYWDRLSEKQKHEYTWILAKLSQLKYLKTRIYLYYKYDQ